MINEAVLFHIAVYSLVKIPINKTGEYRTEDKLIVKLPIRPCKILRKISLWFTFLTTYFFLYLTPLKKYYD